MNVLRKLKVFYKKFRGEKGIVGYSVKGTKIYYFTVRKTDYPKVIVTYGIHAREYITTYLAMRQINHFINVGKVGCVTFVPAVNPDGIKISLTNKPLYKANANGVDLNVNFDANWGSGASNVTVKGDQNYIGKHPFCQPESKALRDLTLKINPQATISYHSKGEEIYWEFFQDQALLQRDKILATAISNATKYPLITVKNSAGGYKDWCIQKLKIPAFTIEVGDDNLSHPIGIEHLQEIYLKNKSVITTLTETICKINI